MEHSMRVAAALALFSAFALAADRAGAVACPGTCSVSDGNAGITVNNAANEGLNDFSVDGVNHIFQEWFWLRVGPAGPETSLDALPLVTTDTTGNTIALNYADASLDIQLQYTLTGGGAGSGTATLLEAVRITNVSGGALDVYFFAYTDFDVNGTFANETGELTAANQITQTDDDGITTATVTSSLTPDAWAIDEFSLIFDDLEDGGPTALANATSPYTGDNTFAFEYDLLGLADGGFVDLTLTKVIQVVPEAHTAVLCGAGLAMLGLWRRRRAP